MLWMVDGDGPWCEAVADRHDEQGKGRAEAFILSARCCCLLFRSASDARRLARAGPPYCRNCESRQLAYVRRSSFGSDGMPYVSRMTCYTEPSVIARVYVDRRTCFWSRISTQREVQGVPSPTAPSVSYDFARILPCTSEDALTV